MTPDTCNNNNLCFLSPNTADNDDANKTQIKFGNVALNCECYKPSERTKSRSGGKEGVET